MAASRSTKYFSSSDWAETVAPIAMITKADARQRSSMKLTRSSDDVVFMRDPQTYSKATGTACKQMRVTANVLKSTNESRAVIHCRRKHPMLPLAYISDNWQKWLPALAVLCAVLWLIAFRSAPTSEQAMFAA